MTLNRKIHRAFHRVRELNFSLHGLVGFDLHGKTAGIVGTGKFGRIVAQILRGFGMRVLAFDPVPNPGWSAQSGVDYVDASSLAAQSDVVSIHIPLTPETKHIIRDETIERMPEGLVPRCRMAQTVRALALLGPRLDRLISSVLFQGETW